MTGKKQEIAGREKGLRVKLVHAARATVNGKILPKQLPYDSAPKKSEFDQEVGLRAFLARSGRSYGIKRGAHKNGTNSPVICFDRKRIEIINFMEGAITMPETSPKSIEDKIIQAVLAMPNRFTVYEVAFWLITRKSGGNYSEEAMSKYSKKEISDNIRISNIFPHLKKVFEKLSQSYFPYLRKLKYDKKAGVTNRFEVRKYFYEKDDVISLDLKDRNIKSFNQLMQIVKDCKAGKPYKDAVLPPAGTEEFSARADAAREEVDGKIADQGAVFKTTVDLANQIFMIANDSAEEIVKLIRDNPGIVGCQINIAPGGVEINVKRV